MATGSGTGTPIESTGSVVPYADLTYAGDYFADRLYTEAWDDASNDDKSKALAMATLNIDRLAFRGEKADPAQDRQWPRGDQTAVPDQIKRACCELALTLLDVNPEEEVESLRFSSFGYSGARTSFNDDRPAWIVALIPSASAWALLLPYLRDSRQLHLSRV